MTLNSKQRWELISTNNDLLWTILEKTQEHTGRTISLPIWHVGHNHSAGLNVALARTGTDPLSQLNAAGADYSKGMQDGSPRLTLLVQASAKGDKAGNVVEPPEEWQSYNMTCGTCGKGLNSIPAADLAQLWITAQGKKAKRIALA